MASPLADRLTELAERNGLAEIYAFGSRAEEMAARLGRRPPAAARRDASDLDVGVLPRRDTRLDAQARARIAAELEDLFDVSRVDLVLLPEAGPFLALDLGRHILSKGFGEAAIEHKEIATGLARAGVLDESEAGLLRTLAGYRNRLVHFYDEVTQPELHEICRDRSGDIERILDALLRWVESNPDRIDHSL